MLVSQYSVTRHYGGPEEGGWWYDWYEFIGGAGYVNVAENDAYNIAKDLNDREQKNKQQKEEPDRFSVLDGTDTVFLAENEAGEEKSTEHPRYE